MTVEKGAVVIYWTTAAARLHRFFLMAVNSVSTTEYHSVPAGVFVCGLSRECVSLRALAIHVTWLIYQGLIRFN